MKLNKKQEEEKTKISQINNPKKHCAGFFFTGMPTLSAGENNYLIKGGGDDRLAHYIPLLHQ